MMKRMKKRRISERNTGGQFVDDDDARLASIMARLTRVERENRRLRQIALSLFLVVGIVLLMGQTRPNRTIEAEQFILKDSNGRMRARLGMQTPDMPTLVFTDPKGLQLVSLGAGENPSLNLCKGSCENQQVWVGTYPNGLFGVALYGKEDGTPLHGLQAALGVVKGVPGLNLYGKEQGENASLDLEMGPRLELNAAEGTLSFIKGSMFLSDPNGNESLGQGSVSVGDKQGFRTTIGTTELESPRTGGTGKTSGASIILADKAGKVLWSAP
jgi:hypothetical protein